MDTVARTTLMIINDRQSFATEQEAPKRPAIEWLLDVMARGDPSENPAARCQTFRIEDDQIHKLLNLPMRPRWWRYSIEEIGPSYGKLEQEVKRVLKREAKQRDEFDQHILKLRRHLELFYELNEHHEPRVIPPVTPDGEWQSLARAEAEARDPIIEQVQAELRARGITDPKKMDPAQRAELVGRVQRQIEDALEKSNPAAAVYSQILRHYKDGKVDAFNRAVADYRAKYCDHVRTLDLWRVWGEVHFNNFAPFYQSLVLYVVVALCAAISWLGYGAPLQKTALWLCLLTFAVHTGGLVARMIIQGRPPVTNLYSSAVFIGWGAVLFGLVLEYLYGLGIGSFVAGSLGFATALVAHFLGTDGDTLEMLQAVLDTDFWLATHVTIVNLGYTATIVPGIIGAVYVIAGLFTPALTRDLAKTLGQMIYGTICFATLLSFTGTVLGGLWADYSWGRFWGWDPKENGALLIVIWNALILHARWAGLIKLRGIATLAILGNVVTIWSWFGTNQLGVGLHAYGFRSGMAKWIVISSAAHMAVAALGMVPLKHWRSDPNRAVVAPKPRREREKPVTAKV